MEGMVIFPPKRKPTDGFRSLVVNTCRYYWCFDWWSITRCAFLLRSIKYTRTVRIRDKVFS